MTNGGFKREKRGFEPPPWEREAFEALGAKAERPVIETSPPRDEPGSGSPGPERAGGPEIAPAPGAEKGPEGGLPPGTEAMLATLQAEERGSTALADTLGSWSGVTVGVLGVVLIVWGVVAAARCGGQTAPLLVAMCLMAVGAMFAAAGAWLAFKSLKRQGVL